MIRFVLIFAISRLCLCAELTTESPNSITTKGYSTTNNKTKDGLTKRGIKVESYDPPPEFYRGHAASTYDNNRDQSVNGYSSRPVAFPGESYGYKGGTGVTSAGQQERKGLHDRISVGHYTSGSSHTGYGNHGGYGSSSTKQPYGPPQAIEYEYYSPTGSDGHQGYSEGGEGIPVELYNRGYGGYGHGGEFTTYTVGSGHESGGIAHGASGYNGGGKQGYDKALLAKSFLIPLASAAVLGIAAALASNPLLLQLGTVSSIGKRRRRDVGDDLSHPMAYRSQRRN